MAPPSLELDEAQLEALSPLLAGSGAGALAWRRLRHLTLSRQPGAARLRQSHVQQALEAQVQEIEIERLLLMLAEHGIEPLLIKGWASARLYPEPGLRPLGDVDLGVRPEQGALAGAVLNVPVDSDVSKAGSIDLKTCLRPVYGLELEEALAVAPRVPLRGAFVRLLSPEHHLRLLCLHFLRHGAWRPLWLCDIAAALETRPADFSWELCLGSNQRRSEWVACALGLAHQLLGANVEGTPGAESGWCLRSWMVLAVLKQWGRPMLSDHFAPPLLAGTPRRLGPLVHALRLRWPDPIEASVGLRLPLQTPPWLAQFLFYTRICLRFAYSSLAGKRA